MNESQLVLFVLSSLLVIMIPGQDLILVMSRGMTQGAKAGIATAAGVSTGLLGHTLLAGLGVGALLMSSAVFFTALKYLGAVYLAWIGIRLLISPASGLDFEAVSDRPLRKLFMIGALSNISNPKITIFYFAYLPQFISPDVANPTLLLLALGTAFSLLTFLVKAPIGYFAGVASRWVRERPIVIRVINRVSGAVLLALGARLAFEQR